MDETNTIMKLINKRVKNCDLTDKQQEHWKRIFKDWKIILKEYKNIKFKEKAMRDVALYFLHKNVPVPDGDRHFKIVIGRNEIK